MADDVYLSVIIPAYNEQHRILPSLEKIHTFLSQQNYLYEVLIIDDGSVDKTAVVVHQFAEAHPRFQLIQNPQNRGKGYAVQTGVIKAQGSFVLFTDADLSSPIEEVSRMLAGIADDDVLIGSRRLPDSHLSIRQPFFREFSGRIFSHLVRWFTLPGFLDTQCGFKLFRKQAARDIFNKLTIVGFGFDVEILFIAVKKLKLRVKEFPIHWADSAPTKVRFLQDSTRMFFDLFRIRWNDLTGRYN